ncbi:MAG: DUF3999 domain-containing protein [Kiritimatiellae bacterium]|nr:DUF3999 domain-containing protein [Kiritimatiellia bacterium]MDW8457587.1 hypothetical protein [Verrucomicrobiota bacterium]
MRVAFPVEARLSSKGNRVPACLAFGVGARVRAAFLGISLCASIVVPAIAAPDPSIYKWRAPILEPVVSGSLYRAMVPLHLFDGSRAFPADLRLIDENGEDVPFFIDFESGLNELIDLPLRAVNLPEETPPDLDDQATYWEVGTPGAPLHHLLLELDGPAARAAIRVYGRKTLTNNWRLITETNWSNLEHGAWPPVGLGDAAVRYLKLHLETSEGGEQPALEAIRAQTHVHYLYFQPSRNGRLWVYYGSDAPGFPIHDLKHRLSKGQLAAALHSAIGPREENPHRVGADLREYAQLLLLTTLAICAVLAAGLLLKRMRPN